jgi:hypothetical protein
MSRAICVKSRYVVIELMFVDASMIEGTRIPFPNASQKLLRTDIFFKIRT